MSPSRATRAGQLTPNQLEPRVYSLHDTIWTAARACRSVPTPPRAPPTDPSTYPEHHARVAYPSSAVYIPLEVSSKEYTMPCHAMHVCNFVAACPVHHRARQQGRHKAAAVSAPPAGCTCRAACGTVVVRSLCRSERRLSQVATVMCTVSPPPLPRSSYVRWP